MKNFIIIMAGGSGTRFWPVSRQSNPKQFQSIGSDDTLLNDTIKRLSTIVPMDRIYIVAAFQHKTLFEQTLPQSFNMRNILFEPMAKNTAAAIACSVQHLSNQYGDINVGIFPADHHIEDNAAFKEAVKASFKASKKVDGIVTLGVPTTFPSTGYGYLDFEKESEVDGLYTLNSFVEKPSYEKAFEYMNAGHYYWNAGIIFSKSTVLLNKIFQCLPELYYFSSQVTYWHQEFGSGVLQELYEAMPSISIDYGVLEHCKKLFMIVLDAGWSDLGSWDAVPDLMDKDSKGNVTADDHILLDTRNSYILSEKKFVAAIGLDDLIIVDTADSLLICKKDHVQDIKKLVTILKDQGRLDLI